MKASIAICLLFIIFCVLEVQANKRKASCVQRALLSFLGKCPRKGKPCIDTCGDRRPVKATTKAECEKFDDCCFSDGLCIQLSTSTTTKGDDKGGKGKGNGQDPQPTPDDSNVGQNNQNETVMTGQKPDAFDEQFVSRFGGSNPVTCNTDRFPYNCRRESYSHNDLQCVVNVPYCFRVPCFAAYSQDEVENNAIACSSYPGCCYDAELSMYRQHFGQRVLPGVPVCHYAVRNHIFQKHAQQYAHTFSGWNPMLTTCLIESLKEEIFGDTPGCYMATVIEFFGLKAKKAGWTGIGPLECYLIDGCYRPNRGCVYPFDASKGIKLSANDPYTTPRTPHDGVTTSGHDSHNKYICQEFTNLNDPTAFLTTYHQCLSSGCSVDASAQNLYLKHLWNISQALGPRGRDQYWKGVMAYEIRADNFLDELAKYKEFYDEPDYDSPIVPLGIQSNKFLSVGAQFIPRVPIPIPNHQRAIYPAHAPTDGRCAFQKPEVPNFPVLRGSFAGCCDKPLCYFSAQQIRKDQLYSELTYYFSAWSAWSKCSKSCHGGRYRRVRKCVSHNLVTPENKCQDQEEIKPCNTGACPHWGQWGQYGDCSVTCGGGLRARRRLCIGSKRCRGSATETSSCNSQRCEAATMWSHWTTCSSTCGKGIQTRARRCISGCPTNFKAVDVRDCFTFCGRIVWGSWSLCNEQACTMERRASCMFHSSPGFCKEKTPSPMTSPCTRHPCYCKKYPTRCRQSTTVYRPQSSHHFQPSQVHPPQRQTFHSFNG